MTSVAQTKTGYDHDNLRHVVITSTCFAFVLSTTAAGLRIISWKINGTGLFPDDILMLSPLLFEYGITIAGIVLLYNGQGTHIIYVKPDQLVVYLKYSQAPSSTPAALSILMLYRRIFPTKPMKISVNVVSSIVVFWTACGILSGCFICIPTEKLWYPQLPGGCMNLSKF